MANLENANETTLKLHFLSLLSIYQNKDEHCLSDIVFSTRDRTDGLSQLRSNVGRINGKDAKYDFDSSLCLNGVEEFSRLAIQDKIILCYNANNPSTTLLQFSTQATRICSKITPSNVER